MILLLITGWILWPVDVPWDVTNFTALIKVDATVGLRIEHMTNNISVLSLLLSRRSGHVSSSLNSILVRGCIVRRRKASQDVFV